MMLVAFDVLASDKADLERLFRLLTQRFAFLTQGGAAPETPNPRLPPLDSGILGGYIAPDNLTITLSVGHSLFDERFGLAPQICSACGGRGKGLFQTKLRVFKAKRLR